MVKEARPSDLSFIPGFLRDLAEFKPLPQAELKQKIKELKDQMTTHQGEFFLVVSRDWQEGLFGGRRHYTTGGCFPERQIWTIKQKATMGICTPPYLDLQNKSYMTIHTPRQVWYRNYRKPNFVDQPIRHLPLHDLERPLPERDRLWVKEPGVALKVVIGDEDTYQWFQEESISLMSHDILESIQERDPARYEEEAKKRRQPEAFVAFFKMQKALGRVLPEQPEEVVQAVEKRKREIVISLREVDEKIAMIDAQLGIIRSAKPPQISDGIHFNDIQQATNEDFEDLKKIRSIPIREELRGVMGELKSELNEAFEFGLHKDLWSIKEELRLGEVRSIDVPYFLRGLSEKYEIPIPQEEQAS